MSFLEKPPEGLQIPIIRVDVEVVGDVVAVVLEGRWIEGQKPYGCHSKVLDVIEFFQGTLEVSNAVTVPVVEGSDMDLVDDGILVPEWIIVEGKVSRYHGYSWVAS